MKKSSLRNLVIALLILSSLASYIYLNTVDLHPEHASPEIKLEVEEADSEDSEMILPDVQMVKRILERSKTLLPAS